MDQRTTIIILALIGVSLISAGSFIAFCLATRDERRLHREQLKELHHARETARMYGDYSRRLYLENLQLRRGRHSNADAEADAAVAGPTARN